MADTDNNSGGERDGLRDHTIVVLLLLSALAVIFRADIFSGSDLFFKAFRDDNPVAGWYPWSRIILSSWQEGLFPLWNPYNLLGFPFLANYQTGVFSPFFQPLIFGPFESMVIPGLLIRLVLAGWGAYIFCRMIGVQKTGARLGALAFGLTGYLTQFINNEHVVIDLLIPLILIGADRLVNRGRRSDLILMIGVNFLILIGGQPSSALFTLSFGYGYALFLIIMKRERRLESFFLLGVAAIVPALICLVQLLPFFEFASLAWTYHTPLLGSAHIPLKGMITAIAPGFYGPLDSARHLMPLVLVAPYVGSVIATLALAGALRPKQKPDMFFTLVMIASLCIIMGVPVINLITRLPGLEQMIFIKYLQPIIALSCAVLAARTTDEIIKGAIGWRLAGSALAIIALVIVARFALGPLYPQVNPAMNGAALIAVVFTGVTLVLSLMAGKGAAPRRRKTAGVFILALVWLELAAASAGNRPFVFRNTAREDFSALELITKERPRARVAAGVDVFESNMGLLAPIFDIGKKDVMFVKNSVDLYQLMTGFSDEKLYLESMRYSSLRVPPETTWNNVTRMAGIRYWLSRFEIPPNRTIDSIVNQGILTAPSPGHSSKIRTSIGGDMKEALFAHPPSRWNINAANIHSNSGPYPIKFSVGIDHRVASLSGDGVWFELIENGTSIKYARYLDPRGQVSEREWKDGVLSLTGQAALITLPGQSADHDWAAWGDLRMGADEALVPDQIVDGIRVYEDKKAWPRVYLAKKVIVVPEGESALERIEAHNYDDVSKTAYIEAGSAPGMESKDMATGESGIEEYGLQRILCSADTEGPGFLVLADAYYPGWRAYVNGDETRIIRTNHGLRGVSLPGGEAKIEFIYKPVSFRVGLWSSLAALAGACMFAFGFRGKLKEE